MERIRNLNRFQKIILLILVAFFLVFTVVYAVVIPRVGFLYHDSILVPTVENGNTVYSGKISGVESVFTVTPDNTVIYRFGDKSYGPYTVTEDPTAVPEEYATAIGAEIRQGEEILFRGGVVKVGDSWMFFDESGTWYGLSITAYDSFGVAYDENGNVVDPMTPSPVTIWHLVNGPALTHKGSWVIWFTGLFASVITAVTILYADELFRFGMAFRVQNPDDVEPSDWELVGRYLSWTVLPIVVLGIYILGLQQY